MFQMFKNMFILTQFHTILYFVTGERVHWTRCRTGAFEGILVGKVARSSEFHNWLTCKHSHTQTTYNAVSSSLHTVVLAVNPHSFIHV